MNNETENNEYMRPPRRKSASSAFSTRKLLGLVFGIFMFIVYEGMGVLLFINFFNWGSDWAWTRWVVGVVLVIYGFFRAYRTYKDLTRKDDDI